MSCWQGVTGEWPCFPPTRPNRRRASDRQDFLIRSCSRPCGYGLTPWRAWAGSRPSDFRGRPLVFGRMFCKCSALGARSRGADMVARVATVAFEGVEARPVDVQVHVAAGTVAFNIVGLGDKAVARIARAGALGADRLGPGAAGQAHHRQSRARRYAEGGQPLRSADRARASWRRSARIPADALEGYAVIGELALDGDDQRRSPACCRRRSPPTRAGKG